MESVIHVPRFSKARDDREPREAAVRGRVDIVLYEGWRVGTDHADYKCLMPLSDHLLCLNGDLELIRKWKFEQSERDAQAAGRPFERDALQWAWERYIAPPAREYWPCVDQRADLVLNEAVSHQIASMHGRFRQHCHRSHPLWLLDTGMAPGGPKA